jgi:uncharacterized membrane protein YeaQ/YmgE (transglycosylase-associated protein family)
MEEWLRAFATAALWVLLFGAFIGIVARFIIPGRQRIGILLTTLIGAVAAVSGHFLAKWLGISPDTGIAWARFGLGETGQIDWARLGIQVLLAVLAIALISNTLSERR